MHVFGLSKEYGLSRVVHWMHVGPITQRALHWPPKPGIVG